MDIDMGAAAFWIALAAVLIASGWFRSRKEQMKHETIRRIVEKSGRIDEEQLKALFQPPAPDWPEPQPGAGYRALWIIGVLVIFFAAGLAAFAGIGLAILGEEAELQPVFAIAGGIAIFGSGLIFCSRFLPKPRPEGSGRNDRT